MSGENASISGFSLLSKTATPARTVAEGSAILPSLNPPRFNICLGHSISLFLLSAARLKKMLCRLYMRKGVQNFRQNKGGIIMIKNRLALDVFYEFVETNGRIPKVREFMDLGYSKSHYYNVKDTYFKIEGERIIKQVMSRETIKGKI